MVAHKSLGPKTNDPDRVATLADTRRRGEIEICFDFLFNSPGNVNPEITAAIGSGSLVLGMHVRTGSHFSPGFYVDGQPHGGASYIVQDDTGTAESGVLEDVGTLRLKVQSIGARYFSEFGLLLDGSDESVTINAILRDHAQGSYVLDRGIVYDYESISAHVELSLVFDENLNGFLMGSEVIGPGNIEGSANNKSRYTRFKALDSLGASRQYFIPVDSTQDGIKTKKDSFGSDFEIDTDNYPVGTETIKKDAAAAHAYLWQWMSKGKGGHWPFHPAMQWGFQDGSEIFAEACYLNSNWPEAPAPNIGRWRTGITVAAGDYCSSGNKMYKALSAGTAGNTPPIHAVTSVSDGAVAWSLVLDSIAAEITPAPGAWTTGAAVAIGDYVASGGRIFKAMAAGITGIIAPNPAVYIASDDAIDWEFVFDNQASNSGLLAVLALGSDEVNSHAQAQLGFPGYGVQYSANALVQHRKRLGFAHSGGSVPWNVSVPGFNLTDMQIASESGGYLRFSDVGQFVSFVGLALTLPKKVTTDTAGNIEVSKTSMVRLQPTTPTEYSTFSGATADQLVLVRAGNDNVTIKSTSQIVLLMGVDVTLKSGSVMSFMASDDGSKLVEMGSNIAIRPVGFRHSGLEYAIGSAGELPNNASDVEIYVRSGVYSTRPTAANYLYGFTSGRFQLSIQPDGLIRSRMRTKTAVWDDLVSQDPVDNVSIDFLIWYRVRRQTGGNYDVSVSYDQVEDWRAAVNWVVLGTKTADIGDPHYSGAGRFTIGHGNGIGASPTLVGAGLISHFEVLSSGAIATRFISNGLEDNAYNDPVAGSWAMMGGKVVLIDEIERESSVRPWTPNLAADAYWGVSDEARGYSFYQGKFYKLFGDQNQIPGGVDWPLVSAPGAVVEFKPGNTSNVIYVNFPDFYTALAVLRPGGDPAADIYDLNDAGPKNWQIELNGFQPYIQKYWQFYKDEQLFFANDRLYRGIAGEMYDQPPSLNGDSKYFWIRDSSVVSAVSGAKSIIGSATAENTNDLVLPAIPANAVGRIIVIMSTNGFTSNGGTAVNGQLANYQKQTDVGPPSSTEVPNLTIWMKEIEPSDSGSTITPTHSSTPNIIRRLSVLVVENMTSMSMNMNDNNPPTGEANKSVGAGTAGEMSVIIASQSSGLATLIQPAGYTPFAGDLTHGANNGHVAMYRLVDPDASEPAVAFSQSVVSLALRLNCL